MQEKVKGSNPNLLFLYFGQHCLRFLLVDVTSKLEGLKTAESKVAPSIASIFVLPSNMGLNQKSDPSLYVDPASDYVSKGFYCHVIF